MIKNLFLVIASAIFAVSVTLAKDAGVKGGQDAPASGIPYQVSLRCPPDEHNCGGSILNKRWILTAAHCLDGYTKYDVVVGSNYLSKGGDRYTMVFSKMHEDYDNNTSSTKHDIGLIKVDRDIVFNERVKPVDLPTRDTPAGVTLMVSGWDWDGIGPKPEHLQMLHQKSISNEECQKLSYHFPIVDTHLCTSNDKAGQGTCSGDSGGPLVDGNQVVGVVSTGVGCAGGYFPDVNERVYSYVDWINKYIKQAEFDGGEMTTKYNH